MSTAHKAHVRSRWWPRLLSLPLLAVLLVGPLAPRTPQPALARGGDAPQTIAGLLPAIAPTMSSWTFQGPSPHTAGQQALLNSTDQPVTGAVRVIAVSPTNPDLAYLGGSNGGVWKTTNATANPPSWTPLTDNLKSQSIGDLALDPLDATGQTLIVGTGRFSAFAQRGDDLAGIYYTSDGGATWTVTTGTSGNLAASDIRAVAARGSTLLATSATGVFISTNGPAGPWTNIKGTRGLPNAPAMDLAPDPANTSRLYLTFTGASGGIYRTNDLGVTWTNVGTGLTGIGANTSIFNAAVYNDGVKSVVYVALANNVANVTDKLIFRSVNGAAFTALDPPTGEFSTTYDYGLATDKNNPDLVYIGGYGCLNPTPYRPAIYRIDATRPAGSQNTLITLPTEYGTPHPDVNFVTVDGQGGLWMGVHGGAFRLASPAAAFSSSSNYWVSKNGNLGISEIHSIAYDHVSHVLIAGIQDNGTAIQSAPGSLSWAMMPSQGGDGGDTVVADIGGGQSVRYASAQSLSGFRRYVYNAAGALVSSASSSISAVTDSQFVTPLAVNAVDPQRLLLAGTNHLYETLNQDTRLLSLDQAAGANRPGALAYGGYRNGVANPDVIYAGFNNKVYMRSGPGGALSATAALPAGANTIADIVMNANDWMEAFAIDDNQVFRTANGGASWTDITGNLVISGLSSTAFTTIEYVPGAAGYLAVGTRSGVFYSPLSNLGAWFKLGSGLPDVLVFDMVYDRTDDVLAVGTLGRGAWLMANAGVQFNHAPVVTFSGPAAVNEDGAASALYSFTVADADAGDSFTVDSLTVGAGGALIPGSLVTTASGGSFRVGYPDGPASPAISLRVKDSYGAASNSATGTISAANVAPTPAIIGAPTRGPIGTAIALTSAVTDPSAGDTSAGFTLAWSVTKNGSPFASGGGASFSFTPDAAGSYVVTLDATDRDGASASTAKTISIAAGAASISADALTLTVDEGQTVSNAGSYTSAGPVTLAASIGTLTQTQATTPPTLPPPTLTPFLSDFNSDPIAFLYAGPLSDWWVTAGNVDVVDYLPFYPNQGHYLDMDGSPGNATIQSKTTFYLPPGEYQLAFKIGQNSYAGGDNGLHVTLGAALDDSFAASFTPRIVRRDFTVTTPVLAPLVFSETGPEDGGGSILDDVQLIKINPLLRDGFDAEPIGVDVTTLGQWDVTQNAVDVIGPGFADFYPGNGDYLDMDGSNNATIQSKTTFNLTPGTYQLAFEIGNNTDVYSDNHLRVTLGSAFDETFDAPTDLTQVIRQFTVAAPISAALVFAEVGTDDPYGSVLDDVQLAAVGGVTYAPAHTSVTVAGSAVPWDATINPAFPAQQISASAPAVVSSVNGTAIGGGSVLRLTYVAGGLDLGGGGYFDPNGAGGQPLGAGYAGGYVTPTPNIAALIGTFADSDGVIVGQPFFVGTGPTTVTAPAGATQLQLGVNDGNYGDNSGEWTIDVALLSSGEQSFSVLGSAAPWTSAANPDYTILAANASAPIVITSIGGVSVAGAGTIQLSYIDGGVTPYGNSQYYNADGDPGTPSGGIDFPGHYLSGTPPDLGSLVGAFTDSAGAIVGQPFYVGSGPTALSVPAGATQLQLGVNDDDYIDNYGAWTIVAQIGSGGGGGTNSWSWSYNATDGTDQPQDVTISATDNASSAVTQLPFRLTVKNLAPTASFASAGAAGEGSSGGVAFSNPSDVPADVAAGFHYAYDFDNDGGFDLGDGTYAGSGAAASASVPASLLKDGPATLTVRGRIIDKDGGFSDYTTTLTISNVAPTASVSGPASALAGQIVTFVVGASDPSALDQAAGFAYSITWGDGSAAQTITRSAGNAATAVRHAFASAGSYSVQVSATDKNGTASAAGSANITINDLTSANLQALIATAPVVNLSAPTNTIAQAMVGAINGMSAAASPVVITVVLGATTYSGITAAPKLNITLDLAGSSGTVIKGASPALTVAEGQVFAQGLELTNDTNAPTVLVTGGVLAIGQDNIQESSTANSVAVELTGGELEVGLDLYLNINGQGGFYKSYDPEAIHKVEDVDAEMTPNTYAVNGVVVSATQRSATDISSTAAAPVYGQPVTFTAGVDVEADEQGPATGTITFYDGATVLGTATVNEVALDVFEASLTTAALSVGAHTITAVYSGNDVYVASSASMTQQVLPYPFAGFFQPVDNPPVVNQVKAGSGVPVKFSLGGNRGLGVLAAGSPSSQVIACSSGAPVDEIEQTTTSNSGLSYDAATGQYVYTWKTDRSWTNTCRQLNVRLADGSSHIAQFTFK